MRLDTELPKSYTVTYTDGVEGEEVFADQVYTVEEGKATPAFNGTPERTGYDFTGWQPEVAETVTADATYTAQWKEQSNAVARLESTGAEYETLASAFAAAKTAMANGSQTITLLKDVNESVSVSWNAIGAKYDYDLTLDLNGKTVTGKSGSVFTFTRTGRTDSGKMNVTFNDSVGTGVVTGGNATRGGAIYFNSQYGCAKLVINGGKFTGNSASDKGGAIYAGFASGSTNPQKTIEVVLAGGEITGNTASEGGGVVAWNNISALTQTGCKVYGNTATTQGDDIVYRATNSGPSYSSKMRLAENAWFNDNSGARYKDGTRDPFTKWASYAEDGKVPAVYLKYVEPTYFTVTYTDGVENEEVFADQTYKVAEGGATPAFVGTPEREGYKFLGWEPAVAEKVTADATYTAQWQQVEKHTITFNGNGAKLSTVVAGSYTSRTQYAEGINVNLRTAMDGKTFVKSLSEDYSTNYRQIGWNTKADGTGTHYEMNGTLVMPAADVTLYAEWESYEWLHWNVQMSEGGDHITYTTKYMGPTADVQSFKAYTGNQGNQYGKVPAALYTPVKAVAKEGYKFIGWYDVEKNECISTNESLFVQDFRNLRALKFAESGSVLEARFEAKKTSNIHVVIYKASDLTKPVVSKAVTNLYAGDTFTPNIADYYSSANGYEYVGWFNDGNFNNYKAGKSYTEATEFTVNGNWQNVIAVVTDYEKVVVKAVYDGDKENAQTVYSGLALHGSNVIEFLEANAGVGEVEGYALDKWFNWDWYGHKVAENATVNGWTNVYVTYTRNVFTVTYTDGVDGEEIFADQSYTVKYGEATPAFDGTPERTGYTFKGWEPAVAETVTEDVTYTAQWEAVKYKLTFNGNGTNKLSGTISGSYTSRTQYTMGTNVNLKTAMDGKSFTMPLSSDYSTNYRQIGWNTKKDGTGDHYEMNGTFVMPASDVTLYAEWEGYEWWHWNVRMGEGGQSITYGTGSGKHTVESYKMYVGNSGNQAGVIPVGIYCPVVAAPKEGYNFIGWYDVENEKLITTGNIVTGTVRNNKDLKLSGTRKEGTLEARFELKDVTVTYTDGVDGEEIFADQSYTVKYGEATPAFVGTPERTGYTFKGWEPAVAETVTEDVTYTAQWEAVKYKLTFNGNGAKLSNVVAGSYTSKTQYTMGTNVNLNTAMDGKKFVKALSEDYSTNYRQTGWNTKADGTGEHYAMNGTFVMPAADTTLYAEWESYEWIYWNVQMGEGGDHITYTTKYMGPTADVQSFKAYTGNSGNQYGKVPAAYYTPVKVVAKEGYNFVGWYDVAKNNCISTKDGLYVQDFRNLRALKLAESGSVLEARFELKDVTVTYVDGVDGAAFASESHTVKYGDPTPAFEGSLDNYTGWVFDGWTPAVADKVTGDVTYTAKWKMKGANTVIYYGNEGELSSGSTFWSEYTNAQTKVLSSNSGYYEFARTGWHFTGWNTKADGTGESYAAGATYTFTAAHNLETVELYAQWERNSYTVTYVDGVDGAAFASESHTVKYEDATPAFEGSLDNYIGWVFNGWTPAVADKVTGDVTYTAKWKMKGANTVIYYGNEGELSNGNTFWSEYTNAQTKVLSSNSGYYTFTRDEYKFTGWNTKADGTGESYAAGATYTFTAAHNLETVELYAQWEHVGCDKHLEDVKVITAPTCTEDGLKLCRCTVCGKEFEIVMPALGHDHSGKWTWNREDHWKKCTRCGEILDLHEHIYGEWKSIDTDREERSCTVCGFTQYAQIIHIGGNTTTKPTDEENPNTGAEVR